MMVQIILNLNFKILLTKGTSQNGIIIMNKNHVSTFFSNHYYNYLNKKIMQA